VQEVPVTRGGRAIGRIVIATDPATEIAKVWRLIETGLVAVCAVSGSTLLLVTMGLSRGLRPLARLADGLRRVGDGDYAARVGSSGPSEIALLGRQFDAMAAQLQRMQGRMRQLTSQLVAVAERERREIARDLHDELGPCLLAANLDVSALIRLNQGRQREAVEDCAKGLAGALDRMQTRVRRMIDRLHLGSVEPLDLGAAVTDLVGFWRERCPEIAWELAPAECWGSIPEAIAPSLFRIIQEALGNAVRHSGAATIAVNCQSAGEETVIRVADDGSGIPAGAPAGFGLSGMRERIEALGGRFVIATGAGQGTTIEARLPAAAIARSADESWERVIA
jgi:two-component system sensor histidine kinase UhpB